MADCFITRRGGGGGKAKGSHVIAVASASALPLSADVGTIAIISSIAVNDVYVNVTAPATPETGDVWITPDAAAENWSYIIGNAVIPFATVQQYNGSAWVEVDTYQYDGSEWVAGSWYLLDGAKTGVAWSTYYAYGGTASKVSTGYKIMAANGGNQPAAIQTSSKVDLTGYSKLCCRAKNEAIGGNFPFEFGIQSSQAYSDGNSYNGIKVITDNSAARKVYSTTGEFTLSLDISKYSGKYYIGISSGGYPSYIYEVWLEV